MRYHNTMDFKSFLDILRRNIIQPVVIAIYVLAIILLQLGEVKDALFMSGVITFNTLFAIVQSDAQRRLIKRSAIDNASSTL